jgi:hypothetical protein
MLEQQQAPVPSPKLQRLTEEIRTSRLLMRERIRQAAGAAPAASPVRRLVSLRRLFYDLRG